MIPADVRVLTAKDLFFNQAALTGESLPVEKNLTEADASIENPAGNDEYLFPGFQHRKWHRHGGGRPDRQRNVFWLPGKQHRRSTRADQL